jgi:hypothetical protein
VRNWQGGLLSRFGQSARYYYLDVVQGCQPTAEDPEAAWQQLETSIVLSRKDLMKKLEMGDTSGDVGQIVRSIVVSKLERFARALCRLFTIGRIGQEAQRYVGYIGSFLHLRDEQLGQICYDPCGKGL